MSDRSEPTGGESADGAEGTDRVGTAGADRVGRVDGGRAVIRLVLGVAVLFALLGGLLVRLAAGASLDGFLGVAVAVLVLTAAGVVFGRGTVRAASERLRP